MRKKRDLDLLDAEERQAQKEADKVRKKKKRELDLLDAPKREAQREDDKIRKK